MSYSCYVFDLELSETITADVEVHFDCTRPGYEATYWEPGEGPEFETIDINVLAVQGEGWYKDAYDLGDWDDIVRKAAEEAIESYSELYEHQYDAYQNYVFEPYWD